MKFSTFLVGLALILTGEVLFLVNLGFGPWGYLLQARKLWPVVLIIAGLSLFWRGRIPRWLAFGITLVLAGGILALFLLSPGHGGWWFGTWWL